MPRITIAQLAAQVATLTAALEAAQATPARTAASTEASAHWKSRDLTCTLKPACGKRFRTTKGRDWHMANVKHGK